jgi:hypothetical protein
MASILRHPVRETQVKHREMGLVDRFVDVARETGENAGVAVMVCCHRCYAVLPLTVLYRSLSAPFVDFYRESAQLRIQS